MYDQLLYSPQLIKQHILCGCKDNCCKRASSNVNRDGLPVVNVAE